MEWIGVKSIELERVKCFDRYKIIYWIFFRTNSLEHQIRIIKLPILITPSEEPIEQCINSILFQNVLLLSMKVHLVHHCCCCCTFSMIYMHCRAINSQKVENIVQCKHIYNIYVHIEFLYIVLINMYHVHIKVNLFFANEEGKTKKKRTAMTMPEKEVANTKPKRCQNPTEEHLHRRNHIVDP